MCPYSSQWRSGQLSVPLLEGARKQALRLADWVRQLRRDPADCGAHPMRRTKAMLDHPKLKSALRYLGIEMDDALQMSEAIEIGWKQCWPPWAGRLDRRARLSVPRRWPASEPLSARRRDHHGESHLMTWRTNGPWWSRLQRQSETERHSHTAPDAIHCPRSPNGAGPSRPGQHERRDLRPPGS